MESHPVRVRLGSSWESPGRRAPVRKWLLFALLMVSFAANAPATTTYYVAPPPTGSNSNPGTRASPFATITYAYAHVVAGDTILVRPGTYTDYQSGWGLHLSKSGTASAPITVRSTKFHGAIIDASGTTFSRRPYGVTIDGSYNVIDGFKISTSPGAGLRVDGDYNQITKNEIYRSGLDPTNGYNGSGIFEGSEGLGNTYAQNYVRDNGTDGFDHGFYLCGDNTTVINNIIVRNAGAGIQIAGYDGVENIHIYNNTIASSGTRGIVLWPAQEDGGTTIDYAQIDNNIIAFNGTDGIDGCNPAGTGNVVSNNVLYGNAGTSINWLACGPFGQGGFQVTVTNTIAADPKFVTSTDFHLQSASPAIDAGLNLGTAVPTDYDGVARPQGAGFDIGAFESLVP